MSKQVINENNWLNSLWTINSCRFLIVWFHTKCIHWNFYFGKCVLTPKKKLLNIESLFYYARKKTLSRNTSNHLNLVVPVNLHLIQVLQLTIIQLHVQELKIAFMSEISIMPPPPQRICFKFNRYFDEFSNLQNSQLFYSSLSKIYDFCSI